MDGVAAPVPGTPAGLLAEWAPTEWVAGALASGWMTAPVRIALTYLTAVWTPELKRTV